MKRRHRQGAAAVVNAAKGGKTVIVFDRLRRPELVAEDIRQVASEMGVKVRVRVAGEGVNVDLDEQLPSGCRPPRSSSR